MKIDHTIIRYVLILAASMTLFACQQASTDLSIPALARVDGDPITKEILNVYLQQQGIDSPTPEQTGIALQNLIHLYVVSNSLKDSEQLSDAELRARLELQERRILFDQAANNYAAQYPTSDADVKSQYDQTVRETGCREYQLEVINFSDQQAALAAIVEINSGQGSFAGYASEHPQTNLGWVTLVNMPVNAANAIKQTKTGEIASVPLPTADGWGVARVAEIRSFTPPPFEQVKDGIRQDLNRKKVEAWVESLRARARVDLENVEVG